MTLIILAGGKSSRMKGRDKAFLPLNQETMVGSIIRRLSPLFNEIWVVAKKPELYQDYPVRVVTDEFSNRGPIGGIHAGLKASSDEYNQILACDLPLVKFEVIEFLLKRAKKDLTIPQIDGYLEPLIAVYSKRLIPIIEKLIHQENYKLTNMLPYIDVDYVTEKEIKKFDPQLESFLNVNSTSDYEYLQKLLND